MESVTIGGCVRTAAAIDDEPAAWVDLLSHALRNGHRPFVEWVLADVEPDIVAQYVADAAKSGSLDLVKWLYAKGYALNGEALENAVGSGNVDLCKWMLDHGLVPDQSTMEAAVEGGHVQVLEWLSTQGCTCTTDVLRHAVRTAGPPVVAWCLDHYLHPPDTGDLLALSCQNVHGTDVFEYLADQRGFKGSPPELMLAASGLHLGYFRNPFDAAILSNRYGTPLHPRYLLGAIRFDDLDRLRFALSQGQEVSGDCFIALITRPGAALLDEVLLAREVGGSIPEADRELIKAALRDVRCHPHARKVLVDHSIVA